MDNQRNNQRCFLPVIVPLILFLWLQGCWESSSNERHFRKLETPHDFAHAGDIDAMEKLLAKGLDPDSYNKDGYSLLYVAVKGNQHEMVRYLIAAGATVDLSTQTTGRTPLFQASYDGFTCDLQSMAFASERDPDAAPLVEMLLKAGANVNARNRFLSTPLHDAVAGKNSHVVRILLRHGADPALEDDNGISALESADQAQLDEIAAILRAHVPGPPNGQNPTE